MWSISSHFRSHQLKTDLVHVFKTIPVPTIVCPPSLDLHGRCKFGCITHNDSVCFCPTKLPSRVIFSHRLEPKISLYHNELGRHDPSLTVAACCAATSASASFRSSNRHSVLFCTWPSQAEARALATSACLTCRPQQARKRAKLDCV